MRHSSPEMGMAGAVAIIPVRGGSVGIPRKNARLLQGKPLLAYAIEAALASAELAAVYVSTEDPELAEIARRFGAQVIDRPEELAGPEVTLDAVIADAVAALARAGRRFTYVVTLQATSPLIRSATIDRVVRQCRERGDDTALTVVNEPHLAWSLDASGGLVPSYRARRNRQQLPPRYRETGGVVVCRSELLAGGSRFGPRISVVEVEKSEAIDIDDAFDWWMARHSLARRRICFRVIGDRETGLGHAYRALTLAERLIDHDVCFLVRPQYRLAAELIRQRFHRVRVAAPEEEPTALREFCPDLIVNDVLDTRKDEIQRQRELGAAIVNFEDLGAGAELADCVINALYGRSPAALGTVHDGPGYCVLRDEFYSARGATVRPQVEEVLLLFGGTDPGDLTRRCLRWLDTLPGRWRITAVLGLGYPHPQELARLAADARHPVELVTDTRIISRYMSRADLAVTSAGRTVFELASLGVPMLVIPQNDRECLHSFARDSQGVVALPRAAELSELEFLGAADELLSDEALRRRLHHALLAADLRSGVERTLSLLEQALRAGEEP